MEFMKFILFSIGEIVANIKNLKYVMHQPKAISELIFQNSFGLQPLRATLKKTTFLCVGMRACVCTCVFVCCASLLRIQLHIYISLSSRLAVSLKIRLFFVWSNNLAQQNISDLEMVRLQLKTQVK